MVGGVPLHEVLMLPSLRGARIVGGARGVDRVVRRVNVMEVPDILGWVGEDELLLTTAYPIREDPAVLDDLVPALAERGLAALAIKPARYIPSIPASTRATADDLAFPIIELPPHSSFNEIITSVLTVILNAQAARLQRAADVHERFTSIVLGGGGLRQIAEALEVAIGRRVAIVDPAGTAVTSTDGVGDDVTVQPIRVDGEHFGSLIVSLAGGALDDEQADAVEYAATISALRHVQARAVAEADRRFQAVCLEELLTGHVDRAVLMERAVAFHWDLATARAVLLVQIEGVDAGPIAAADSNPVQRRVADAVRQQLGRTGIVWERTTEVAALVPAMADALARRDVATRVAADVERSAPGWRVRVGLGRPRADPLALGASAAEARRALDVARRRPDRVSVVLFDDLGVDRLLATVPQAEAEDFARALLATLEDHDARHRTAFVPTLRTFLETRNAALAARHLYIHYNTMKLRLAAIEDLIGPFRTDPDRCLALSLALRIREGS